MKKSLFVSLLSLSIAFALQAQTEPEKTPLTGKSPAAGPKKTPANPPPVQTSGTKSGEAGAKPSDDTNAKPIDSSNMDPSVKPADDSAAGGAGQDRQHERSTRRAEGDRASASDRRERIFQFRVRSGRQRQHARDCTSGPRRTRNAGPRLLHQGRRRFEEIARPIRRACHQNVDPAR